MKKMKKTLLLAFSFVLVAVVSVTSTIAYLSAQDSAVNVMTSGKVDIELIEQQRDGKGGLEEFTQGKELLPLVGSAQGEKDKFGMPKANNYVDKIVTVKNTGANDAWVRILVGFPTALDHEDASKMALHWNDGYNFNAEGNFDGTEKNNDWAAGMLDYTITIDGVEYNIYTFTYKTALASGEETASPAITGFYLDKGVNYDADKDVYTITYADGTTKELNGFDGNVVIPVIAQAVQYGGFETSSTTAFEEAFPATSDNVTKWFTNLGVTVAKADAGAVRPAGVVPKGNELDGVTVIDSSDKNVNLRALYNEPARDGRLDGDFTVTNSYLDGTYAMNVYGNDTGNLTVSNTDLRGWVSYSNFKTAKFENCTFGQNSNPEYYNNVRPYSTITFVNCDFDGTTFWLDMVPAGATVTFENCTMNGETLTETNLANYIVKPAPATVTVTVK